MLKNFFKFFFCLFFITHIYSQTILIKNGTIYDGENNDPFVGNILIEDEFISRVSSASIQGDFVIDATGMIITPGLIATDTDIGIVEIGALSVTRDDSSELYKIGFSIFDAFNPNSTLIPWNRSNGITSAITLPQNTSSPIGGLGSFFVLDGNLEISGEKDIVMIGEVGGDYNASRSETFAIIDDLLIFAKSINQKDLNSNKDITEIIGESSIAESMDLHPRDVKALYKIVNGNIPIIIKANRASDILKLIKIKNNYGLNLVIMGAQEAHLVSEAISENQIPLIINPINNIPNSFDELASNIEMAKRLEEAGVEFTFNVSRSHNFHLIRQGAGVAVANGMSYSGAMKSITSNPAKFFDIKKRGILKAGNYADIIIWDADPLEPSSMPELIFVNGENIDLTNRSTRLRDRYTKEPGKPATYRN